jgi:hypothetical protein
MEDVVEGSQRPSDPRFPKVCMDEGSTHLLAHTRQPIPMATGERERVDDEEERQSVCPLFIAVEPETGACQVHVSTRRTTKEWAVCMREMIDVHDPRAENIVPVMDTLNTPTPSLLYEVFEPAEARRVTEKLEINDTPTHGRWLTLAEIERSVLARQCLSDRFPSREAVTAQIDAWLQERTQAPVSITWRCPTADARITLTRPYPSTEQ